MSAERLQKVLASAGIASRRDCEALIAAGRVTVNGRVVLEPGLRVDPEQDVIQVDGEMVRRPVERTYIMVHKPVGYVSTVDDPQGRPTVLDLVDVPTRVFPVGRLDVDSEGLILLTDDGELTHYLTHPKFEVEKEYRVLLDRPLDSEALRQWRAGVLLNGELTAPAWVELIETAPEGPWYRVVLREGRKRQIREVAKLLGYEVQRLIRVREGDIALGDLPPRKWRSLTPEEVARLRSHVPARPPRDEEGAASGRAPRAGVATGAAVAAGGRAVRGPAGERPPRREGGYREERPSRREGGYREERPPRYEERPPRREGGYREERPSRREGGYREERPSRRE
ncbi:MAG: pseudouridine synthase, partial [Chloroflexaceae bacterium]|nr:pseudouridine synthase [Chloroflexaceae bacterium]